jgi:AraC-like DNA-binding protein
MQTLAEFGNMSRARWPVVEIEDWRCQLQSICGRFNPIVAEGARVRGAINLVDAGGLGIARVASNVDETRRELSDIRADYGENLFLLLQLEGSCGVEQRGRQSIITPGDCILVDSSSPSIFHFGGRFSNHLSVHLPRQLFMSGRSTRIEVSRRLAADEPMALVLRALIAQLISTDARDQRAPHLRELLFSTTRYAFAADPDGADRPLTGGAERRLDVIQMLIDRHLTDEFLSPQWLAEQLGVSLRTLQDDFSALGTTATEFIRIRRLQLVHDRLQQMQNAPSAPTIAEIAFSAGFSDVSYFNRAFRKFFACSPTDVLHQ